MSEGSAVDLPIRWSYDANHSYLYDFSAVIQRVPLYHDVKEKIIQGMASGDWSPGAKLPVEGDLARRYGVAISTVRAAITELQAAGVLIRQQGKGTFVAEHSGQSRMARFFNLVTDDGRRENPVRSFVSLRRDRVTAEESEFLQLTRYGRGDSVYRLRTTFSLQGKVTAVNDVVLPAALFAGLKKADVISESNSTLYSLYQLRYNVNVVSVAADLSAVSAPDDVSALLEIEKKASVLFIKRKAYTFNGEPVELRVSWVNTAHCKFHVDQGSMV